MATASISLYSNSQSGNGGNGKYEFGYTAAITGYYTYVYSTYKFTLSSATTSLSAALNYKILGNSKTIYWRIDQSSTNSSSFTEDGSFSSGSGGTASYTSHSKTVTKTGSFAAGTYYLHLRTNGGSAGYGYLSSGTVTYNAVATYTITFNANSGTVPALTSVSPGTTGGTLTKGVNVPVIQGSKIALTANQQYLLEFSYLGSGSTPFHIDLYPDTLPQIQLTCSTTSQRHGWVLSSSSSDMGSCQVRFFNDLNQPNPQNIYISTVKLYKIGSGASTTSKVVENGSQYGYLPTPTRSGYVFLGWFTAASGGTQISTTSTVNLTANQTIYAHWAASTYTISYNANGGTGAPANQTKNYGTALTLSTTKPTKADATANGYTITFDGNNGTPSKTSATATDTTKYTFSTWNTAANGSGTSYASGGSYTANAAATLYAQYTSSVTKGSITTATATRSNGSSTRTVTFDATTNGGTCSTTSLNSTATITYTCKGWFEATSGGSAVAAAGASYTPTATDTLYAQWNSSTGTFSTITLPTATKSSTTSSIAVTINANGGTSSVTSKTSTKTIAYTLTGWYDAASGGTLKGKGGAKITPSATDTYYAQFSSSTSFSAVTLPTAAQCTHDSYELLGFATSPTATSVSYLPGASYTPSAAITLYAIWGLRTSYIQLADSVNAYKPYQAHIFTNGSWQTCNPYIYTNGTWVACDGKTTVANIAIPDTSARVRGITQYKDLDLEQPGLIGGEDYYLGWIFNQGYYWLQFTFIPTVYTTSLKFTLNLPTLIAGSVSNANFPWKILIADTNAAPTVNEYTSIIHQAPNRKAYMTWNVDGLALMPNTTYYLSVWAGSSSYPGGVMCGSGKTPSYSIISNPSA